MNRFFRVLSSAVLIASFLVFSTGCRVMGVKVPDGWKIIRPLDGILSMVIQGDTVWVGTKNGLYQVDRKSETIIGQVKTDPPLTYVKALLLDKNGLLYIGHFNGLTTFDGNTYRTYTTEDGLPDNRVNSLLQTGDGTVWVGSWGGASAFSGGRFSTLTRSDGLADDMVNVMLQDDEGGMWFGSAVAPAGGITYVKDGRFQVFTTANRLPHDDVTSLYQDRDGNVWAGTGLLYRGGAAKFTFSGSNWTISQTFSKSDGLAGEKVRSIFQDNDGTIWFGAEYDGMTSFSNGKWRTFNEKNGLSGSEVTCTLQEGDGTLWFGTSSGITRMTYAAAQALR